MTRKGTEIPAILVYVIQAFFFRMWLMPPRSVLSPMDSTATLEKDSTVARSPALRMLSLYMVEVVVALGLGC